MLWHLFAFSQHSESILTVLQADFNRVDSNHVPHGILLDRTIPLGSPQNLIGLPDSVCSTSRYLQVYLDMYNAAYHSKVALPTIDQLRQRASVYLDQGMIPLSLLHLHYSEIKPEAVDSHLIGMDSVNFSYVSLPFNSRKTSYEEREVFAGAFMNPVLWRPNNTFIFPTELVITNGNQRIQALEVDFNDGNGWRNITIGQAITISYPDWTQQTVGLSFRWIDGDGHIYYGNSLLQLVGQYVVQPDSTIEVTSSFIRQNNRCNINFPFQSGDARIYIDYAQGNVLTKPIILIEGFDIDANAQDKRYGNMGWNTLLTGKYYNEDGEEIGYQLANAPVLIQKLRDQGYDIVLIDFKDGGKRIEANSQTVINILQWINRMKVTQEGIVVLGLGAGGLLARYALTTMEQHGCRLGARLYATFDTPHRGANIPIGIQHFFRFYAEISKAAKDIYEKQLCSDAAKQMLIYHIDSSAKNSHNQWQSTIQQIGHPIHLVKLAFINGSSDGTGLEFEAGEQLLHYDVTKDLSEFKGHIWSVPNSPDMPSHQLIFHGKVPRAGTKTMYRNMPMLPWRGTKDHYEEKVYLNFPTVPIDNAPGGTHNIITEMVEGDFPFGNLEKPAGDRYCFVPSISALDITTSNPFKFISELLMENPEQTPFDDYYLPDVRSGSYNQKHMTFSTGNIDWLVNRMATTNSMAGGTVSEIQPQSATPFYTYPNPSHQQVTVGWKHIAANVSELVVWSPQGKMVYHVVPPSGAKELHIDVAGWQRGLYTIELKDQNGAMKQKLVLD